MSGQNIKKLNQCYRHIFVDGSTIGDKTLPVFIGQPIEDIIELYTCLASQHEGLAKFLMVSLTVIPILPAMALLKLALNITICLVMALFSPIAFGLAAAIDAFQGRRQASI